MSPFDEASASHLLNERIAFSMADASLSADTSYDLAARADFGPVLSMLLSASIFIVPLLLFAS